MVNRKYIMIPMVILLILLFIGCESVSLKPGPTESANKVYDDFITDDNNDALHDDLESGDPSLQPGSTESPVTMLSNDAMLNKMHYVLPDDLASGEFDIYLGGGGGIPFLKTDNPDNAIKYGGVELQLGIDGIFENGNLIGVQSFANHSSFSEFTSFSSSVPAVTVFYSYDIYDEDTNRYVGEGGRWYAFWAVEGCKPVYALYVNADYYDYEDFLAIAETVTFSEGAFVFKENVDATPDPDAITE